MQKVEKLFLYSDFKIIRKEVQATKRDEIKLVFFLVYKEL
jgi:hypothetical protein